MFQKWPFNKRTGIKHHYLIPAHLTFFLSLVMLRFEGARACHGWNILYRLFALDIFVIIY